MKMKKNIIIAGGAGFIGYHLVERLKSMGHNVIIIDNLCTGSASNIPKSITNIIADINKPSTFINSRWSELEYDEIWNCACPASPVAYRNMPLQTLDTCYLGTKNLLEFARIKKAKYIHLSTSEVYGCTPNEMVETNWGYVNCFGPRACYDEGKRISETLIYEYEAAGLVDARIFRLFNTFGPRMKFNDGRVIPNFIVSALTDKPLRIYGSPCKTRTFNYVDNVIDVMLAAAQTEYNKPINIGTDKMVECELETLARVILELIPESNSLITYEKNPTDDPSHRVPNIKLLLNLIDKPEKSKDFIEGLKETIEYFREFIAENPSAVDCLSDDSFSTYKTPSF